MSYSKQQCLEDLEDLKSEHRCFLCVCDYDEEGPHKPLLLKCAHTVCRQCIMTIADLPCVSCPLCGEKTFVSRENVDVELRRNYTMSTVGSLFNLFAAQTAMYEKLLHKQDGIPRETAIQDVQERATAISDVQERALQEPILEPVRTDASTSAGSSTAPLQSASGCISILPPRRNLALDCTMNRNSMKDPVPVSIPQRSMNDRDLPMFPFASPPRYETTPDLNIGRKRRSDPGRYVERIDDQPTYPHSSRQNESNPELDSNQVDIDMHVPRKGAGKQQEQEEDGEEEEDEEEEEDGEEEEDDDDAPPTVVCIFCDQAVLIDELDIHENICRRFVKPVISFSE